MAKTVPLCPVDNWCPSLNTGGHTGSKTPITAVYEKASTRDQELGTLREYLFDDANYLGLSVYASGASVGDPPGTVTGNTAVCDVVSIVENSLNSF